MNNLIKFIVIGPASMLTKKKNNDIQMDAALSQSPLKKIIWGLVILIVIGICGSIIGYCVGWFSETGQVAQEQFGPRAGIQKYEWFINQVESLKRTEANIKTTELQIQNLRADYSTLAIPSWPRDAREDLSRLEQNKTDFIMNYNRGVADYNAQSEKFNWSIFQSNVGIPPQRLTEYATK